MSMLLTRPEFTHVVAFLAGLLSGVVGQYYATKLTEMRQRKESTAEIERAFKNMVEVMPELLREMRDDLLGDKTSVVRNAVILPKRGMVYNGEAFIYYEEEHPGLRNKIAMLQDNGFVSVTQDEYWLPFRLSDQLVGLLNRMRF